MRGRIFLAVAFFIVAGVVFYIGAQISKEGNFMTKSAKPANMVVDSLAIVGVSQLVSEGVCDIELHLSDKEIMTVSYDAAHCTNHSRVDGEKLNIHFGVDQVGFFDFTIRPDVKIDIYTKRIHSYTNRGTGHITSKDTFMLRDLYLLNEGVGSITCTTLSKTVIAINRGVGSIDLYGRAEKIDVSNEGVGSLTATGLLAANVKARNSGIGAVNVYGIDSLSIANDGLGSLGYSGPGEVYYERNDGIGSIKRIK